MPQAEAIARGHDQVVFLDAAEHRWVEELGGMNVFFVFDDGTLSRRRWPARSCPASPATVLITPRPRQGLDGARGALLHRPVADRRRHAAACANAFACGTAAVVTPIGTVRAREGEFTIGNGGPGARTEELKSALVDIQRGRAPDPHGWIHKVF